MTKCKIIRSNEKIKKFINKTFDLVTKNAFDLVPNLTEAFDLLKRSSEIQSSDHLPYLLPTAVFPKLFKLADHKKLQNILPDQKIF